MRCPACGAETPDTRADCAACGVDLLDFEQTARVDPGGASFAGGGLFAGRYVIERRLGRGAMGVVLLARDTKLGSRQVALKLLPFELAASQRARRALRREAEKAARLTHPGIVRVYDYDEHEGQLFVCMEYVEGRTLQQAIDEQPMPVAEIVRTGTQLARALDYAHSHGVLHRDVKPSNVFLSRSGEVKLGDFGISREADTQATRTGTRLSSSGTPAYMAPEAIQGVREDERSDEYSLGCTLYALATGSPPFTIGDVSYQHVHSEPAPPSSKRPGLPPQFDKVVLRCLAKRPEDRFPSTRAVADALAGRSPRADRTPASREAARVERPRRRSGGVLVLLGVLCMLALVVAGVGWANGWFDPWLDPPHEPAPSPQQTSGGAVETADEPASPPAREDPVGGETDTPAAAGVQAEPAESPPDTDDPTPEGVGAGKTETPPTEVPEAPVEPPTEVYVDVKSDPPGASVTVDGVPRGTTPLRLALAVGADATIRLTKEFHEPFETRAVDPAPGEVGVPRELSAVLVRSTGVLTLKGGPPGAAVTLEREGEPPRRYTLALDRQGELNRQEIEAGRYRVTAGVPGFTPCDRWATVGVSGQAAVDLGMVERDGTLSIDSHPQGALVHVDGKPVGRTPLHDHALPPGDHRVELSLDEHDSPPPMQIRIRGEKRTDLGTHSLGEWPVVDLNPLRPGTVVRIEGRVIRGGERVQPGEYTVELEREGHVKQIVQRTAVPGRPFVIRADDWVPSIARLDLGTLRAGERATIDGKQVSGLYESADEGVIVVVVSKDGCRDQTIEVRLERGETKPLRVGPWTPGAGTVDLSALAQGVTADVKGSVLANGEALTPGRYTITLRRPEHEDQVVEISVEPGRVTRVVAPGPWRPAALGMEGIRALLADVERWDAARPASRRRAAELVAQREADFELRELRAFASGGARHEMALFVHAPTGLEFALIPGGTFRMGSPEDEPGRGSDEGAHEVTLTRPFLLCRTECTQKAWKQAAGRALRVQFPGDDHPVESVTWEQADAFCRDAGLRLPTEAEWEYACRAGTGGAYTFGSDPDGLADQVWFARNSPKQTQPVGGRPPNAFGLLDMLGNVQEWCADWYAPEFPTGPETDPAGPEETGKRVARGGSMRHREQAVRCASRQSASPRKQRWDLGFRPAKTVAPLR